MSEAEHSQSDRFIESVNGSMHILLHCNIWNIFTIWASHLALLFFITIV
jgi:hypothetical protein